LKNILLGHTESGFAIELDTDKFLGNRLLLQGISGSWKTETIKTIVRGLKEVTRSDESPNGIQQIIFDWEGEYHPLRKSFPYLLIGDESEFSAVVDSAEDLAIEIRKKEASVIIDLSSFKDHEQRQEYVGIFINAILEVPKQYWNPCTVIIDEAHNLCRQGESRSLSKKPIIRLCETGRKRGISTILGTQRLAALDKNASAQMVNRLIGMTVEVPDREAAARLLGMGRDVSDQIKDFKGGEFFAFGPALSERKAQKFKVVEKKYFEKTDLRNVTPLNSYGKQIFAQISDSLNMSSGFVNTDDEEDEEHEPKKETNNYDLEKMEELNQLLKNTIDESPIDSSKAEGVDPFVEDKREAKNIQFQLQKKEFELRQLDWSEQDIIKYMKEYKKNQLKVLK